VPCEVDYTGFLDVKRGFYMQKMSTFKSLVIVYAYLLSKLRDVNWLNEHL